MSGEISESQAGVLMHKVLRDEGIPVSYDNHPRTHEAAKGLFLLMGGC